MSEILKTAKEVFEIESKAIKDLSSKLTADFEKAIDLVMKSKGRLVITGMGKSGHIGGKIAATLASTGTTSFFMHPAEAIHGDLGMLSEEDVVMAISNSGNSEEIVKIIPMLQRRNIPIIGMTGNKKSILGKECDAFLDISVYKEACVLQLAPTSSTTATLAMGDAFSVVLMKEKGFQPEDFAMFHPGGSLGRKLLTKAKDLMIKKPLPIINDKSNLQDIIHGITDGQSGLVIVKDLDGFKGIITDGDLRRAMEGCEDINKLKVRDMIQENPLIIPHNMKLQDIEEKMIENKINTVLVEKKEEVIGLVTLYDVKN